VHVARVGNDKNAEYRIERLLLVVFKLRQETGEIQGEPSIENLRTQAKLPQPGVLCL
jgi:hypothetical protein